ncbi:MPN domain-containing protein isoform X2 [Orussus abietinus]|uniref:MPN domain-containing protein isoform X2 n=1 Tax=Orussus abietinus TaxID=222816 RepID=UPI000625D87F|nr:MPN domain-containing protein isoform X2 [Orussus abietinus]
MMDIVGESGSEEGQERSSCLNSATVVRVPVKHANLGIRSHAMDMSTMVELTSFSTLGKIQPFLVTISTTAALVVDLHCHLSDKEVCGYLGGHWDINAHNLAITNAFPCRYAGKDKQAASLVELEIARAMEWKRTTLVGWYHSHPRSHASPSLRDVDSQLDYQIKMKGISDNGYTPCVGLICSPYNTDGNCYESNFNVFWSMPPPENRPHEYPRPMLLSYSLSQEHFLPQDALEEIKKCIDYYKSEGGIDFMATFNGNTTYLERLRSSLASKLPGRNQSNGSYWDVIREMICPGAEDPPPDPFISSATTSMKYSLMTDSLNQPSSLSANSLFLAPAKFKTDNSSNPSTSRDKDDGVAEVTPIYAMAAKDSSLGSKHRLQADPVPSFQSGELTVSVKNTKCEYEFPSSGDFSKISSLLGDSSSKFRPATGDFPLADISQVTKFSELSKLANFSTADLAKLSGFALNDFTKMSPSRHGRLLDGS